MKYKEEEGLTVVPAKCTRTLAIESIIAIADKEFVIIHHRYDLIVVPIIVGVRPKHFGGTCAVLLVVATAEGGYSRHTR
jgi:hypothetical protein